jgi:prepilin-type N-terminal cleavage/methylation domain-containing protein
MNRIHTMKRKLRQGFTLVELLVVIAIIATLASLAMPALVGAMESSRISEGTNNCRQLLMFMKQYAQDNGGLYPDDDKTEPPTTANEAFRLLVKQGFMTDEKMFNCPNSPFRTDKNIGEPPDFQEACAPGECHWAMTKGLSDSSKSNSPLIFENPVSDSWPPTWNADAAGKPLEGRSWSRGRIIIGKNDGSVTVEQMESFRGDSVPLKPNSNGKDLFTESSENGEILNVQKD